MKLDAAIELTIEPSKELFVTLFSMARTSKVSEDDYTDNSLGSKGMQVTYHDSQYRKKIQIKFILSKLQSKSDDTGTLMRKIGKRLCKYFGRRLEQLDFTLSSMVVSADLAVGQQETVEAYMTVLRRIGNVKGYTLDCDCRIGGTPTFLHWSGNSNSKDLILLNKRCFSESKADSGILQARVYLLKNKAVRTYCSEASTPMQIARCIELSKDIFLDTFAQIVPSGSYFKKETAVKHIRQAVGNINLRQKMIRLLELIPEKKSLLRAQKAMTYRKPQHLLLRFAKIDLSPITISKRQKISSLGNLYTFL